MKILKTETMQRTSEYPSEIELVEEILHQMLRRLDIYHVLQVISEVCNGHFYIFGGLIRNYLIKRELSVRDLDILTESESFQNKIFERLNDLHIPFERNTEGHRRYLWGYGPPLQIDISHPGHLFGSHASVEAAISNFDVFIDAVAIRIDTRELINPVGGIELAQNGNE